MAVACLLICAFADLSPADPCWVDGTWYSFDRCCQHYASGLGNPQCWDGEFTYEHCCLPELRSRIDQGLQLVHEGHYLRASKMLFNLERNFVAVNSDEQSTAFAGWAKAATEFRKDLDAAPHSLSWFEVIFHGLGIDCEPPSEAADLYFEFARCCDKYGVFTHKSCNLVFEMMAHALGRGRHRGVPAEADAYYANMSEMWAFHHFTPSILKTDDIPKEFVEEAYQLNQELARIFESAGEPSLGIVWSDYVSYRSPKFLSGIYFMTLLLTTLQRAGISGPLHMFEIGAGFGSLPRIFSHARRQLVGRNHPFDIQNYAVLDVRFVIDLQRWYLKKTAGESISHRDWIAENAEELIESCGRGRCWPGARPATAPLQVDFVDTDMRDLFAHHYSEAQSAGLEGGRASGDMPGRATRVLVAVNSWHEFPMADFLWYYNTFVAAPLWRTGVDWILYVSNREWDGNAAKEALLLEPRANYGFAVQHEECSAITCIRILRRTH